MTIRNFIKIVENQLNELAPFKNDEKVQKFSQMVGNGLGSEYQRDALEHFGEFMKEKGFTPLGSGAKGIVFEHPSLDYVFKVFANDPAYLKFYNFAMKRQSNPHLPKFRGKLMTLDKKHFLIRMEKLRELETNAEERMGAIFDNMQYFDDEDYNEFKDANLDLYQEGFDLIDSQAGLLSTIFTLQDMVRRLDLHPANFMMRDNTVVIIDPFV